MRFKKFRRWVHRLFDRTHNEIVLGKGSVCEIPLESAVTETTIRIHGRSRLVISQGAHISNSRFQVDGDSFVFIGPDCVLDQVDICLWNKSSLKLGDRCRLSKVHFILDQGTVAIGPDNIVSQGEHLTIPIIRTSDGELIIEDHNNLSCSCWIRFGGKTVIGKYNCINNGTEIRCDESVIIGSYNMVSYQCDIWDTNTHADYSLEEKRVLFEKDFPSIGMEKQKPRTRPISIGDGNWIGKNACILKGSTIGNDVTVGTRAIVSQQVLEDGTVIVPSKGQIV